MQQEMTLTWWLIHSKFETGRSRWLEAMQTIPQKGKTILCGLRQLTLTAVMKTNTNPDNVSVPSFIWWIIGYPQRLCPIHRRNSTVWRVRRKVVAELKRQNKFGQIRWQLMADNGRPFPVKR
jgi:hypothetical protein